MGTGAGGGMGVAEPPLVEGGGAPLYHSQPFPEILNNLVATMNE